MATDRGRELLFKNKGKDSEVFIDFYFYHVEQVSSHCVE